MAVVEPAAMSWSLVMNWAGYGLGLFGIVLLIWSLLKQGVSLLGLALLTAGFLLLLLHDFLVY